MYKTPRDKKKSITWKNPSYKSKNLHAATQDLQKVGATSFQKYIEKLVHNKSYKTSFQQPIIKSNSCIVWSSSTLHTGSVVNLAGIKSTAHQNNQIQYRNHGNNLTIYNNITRNYFANNINACYEERRFNNFKENFRFTQNGPIQVIMYPITYPFIGFDQENAEEIIALLERAPREFFEIRIPYIREENRIIKAVCLDQYSKNRLCQLVSTWVFRLPGVQQSVPIQVLLKNKIPDFVLFECILRESIGEHAFLSKVYSENDVDTRRSHIDYRGYTSRGYRVLFRADPVCACEISKHHFNLKIRGQNVYFKILDNPFINFSRVGLPFVS